MKKPTGRQKELAIAKIRAGKSSAAAEAKGLGVTPTAVRKWLRDNKRNVPLRTSVSPSLQGPARTSPAPASLPGATGAGPEPAKSPPEEGGGLDAARAALLPAKPSAADPRATAPPASPLPLGTYDPLAIASAEDQAYCLEITAEAKKFVGQAMADRAGLNPEHPLVAKHYEVGSVLKVAVKGNASWLAPWLKSKLAHGPYALAIACAIEFFALTKAMNALAAQAKGAGEKPSPPPATTTPTPAAPPLVATPAASIPPPETRAAA